MRRTFIITLAVLIASLALCGMSYGFLRGTVEKAQSLRAETLLAVDRDEPDRALDKMTLLAEFWSSRNRLMEMIASHDDLHEVASAIAEAKICLECRDHDDFLRTMSIVGQGLEHILDEETVALSNLY